MAPRRPKAGYRGAPTGRWTVREWRARFPAIPGAQFPKGPASLELLHFGDRIADGIIDEHPPAMVDSEGYGVFVSAPDADGNDVGGVTAPMVATPLGTFTGWIIRNRETAGSGAMSWFDGSYRPFEPLRVCRRPFCLSHAAMSDCSRMA